MMYNSKCFFCNQEVKSNPPLTHSHSVTPDLLQLCEPHLLPHSPNYKEISHRAQKYGPGYSHVLTSLKDKDLESSDNKRPAYGRHTSESVKARRYLKSSVGKHKVIGGESGGNVSAARFAPSPGQK
jgi:hypothetical protein